MPERNRITLAGAMRVVAVDESGSEHENVQAVDYLFRGADRIDRLEAAVEYLRGVLTEVQDGGKDAMIWIRGDLRDARSVAGDAIRALDELLREEEQ